MLRGYYTERVNIRVTEAESNLARALVPTGGHISAWMDAMKPLQEMSEEKLYSLFSVLADEGITSLAGLQLAVVGAVDSAMDLRKQAMDALNVLVPPPSPGSVADAAHCMVCRFNRPSEALYRCAFCNVNDLLGAYQKVIQRHVLAVDSERLLRNGKVRVDTMQTD